MTFGKRNAGGARAGGAAGRLTAARPPIRGGYLVGLACAVMGFGVSAALVVIWAFATDDSPGEFTPGSLFTLTLLGAGPIIATTYAISLALAGVLLRAFQWQGHAQCAGLSTIFAVLLLILPMTLLYGPRSLPVYLALVLPGAVFGGIVLGGFRRS